MSRLVGVLITILTASLPLQAHHSAAGFDRTKEVTLKGTVVTWRWANPHCVLLFEAKDSSGTVRRWAAETGNPTGMAGRGWSRTMFQPGSEITATVSPSRNGEPVGLLLSVILPDGRKMDSGEAARVERSIREQEEYKKPPSPGSSN